ncbi:hypothetical protein WA158_003084 [Blastocystis sp. Blastoise]
MSISIDDPILKKYGVSSIMLRDPNSDEPDIPYSKHIDIVKDLVRETDLLKNQLRFELDSKKKIQSGQSAESIAEQEIERLRNENSDLQISIKKNEETFKSFKKTTEDIESKLVFLRQEKEQIKRDYENKEKTIIEQSTNYVEHIIHQYKQETNILFEENQDISRQQIEDRIKRIFMNSSNNQQQQSDNASNESIFSVNRIITQKNQLEKEIEELKKENNTYKTINNTLTETMDSMKRELNEKKTLISSLQLKYNEIYNNQYECNSFVKSKAIEFNDTHIINKQKTNNMIESLSSNIQVKTDKMKSLSNELKYQRDAYNKIQETIDELRLSLVSVKQSLEDEKQSFQQGSNYFNSICNEYIMMKYEDQDRNNQSQNNYNDIIEANNTLVIKNNNISNEIKNVKQKYMEINNQYMALKEEYIHIVNLNQEIEANIDILKESKKEVEEKYIQLLSSFNELQEKYEGLLYMQKDSNSINNVSVNTENVEEEDIEKKVIDNNILIEDTSSNNLLTTNQSTVINDTNDNNNNDNDINDDNNIHNNNRNISDNNNNNRNISDNNNNRNISDNNISDNNNASSGHNDATSVSTVTPILNDQSNEEYMMSNQSDSTKYDSANQSIEIQSQYDILKNEYKLLEIECEQYKNTIDTLQQEKEESNNKYASLYEDYHCLQELYYESEEKNIQLQKISTKNEDSHNYTALDSLISTLKEENNNLKEENNNLKEENNILKEENNILKEENNTLKEENNSIKEENDSIKEENTKLSSINVNIKKEQTSFSSDVSDMNIDQSTSINVDNILYNESIKQTEEKHEVNNNNNNNNNNKESINNDNNNNKEIINNDNNNESINNDDNNKNESINNDNNATATTTTTTNNDLNSAEYLEVVNSSVLCDNIKVSQYNVQLEYRNAKLQLELKNIRKTNSLNQDSLLFINNIYKELVHLRCSMEHSNIPDSNEYIVYNNFEKLAGLITKEISSICNIWENYNQTKGSMSQEINNKKHNNLMNTLYEENHISNSNETQKSYKSTLYTLGSTLK